ncbi:MAG: signal recognition particle-docking protein FtsY [Firmicutes bacterium]|jgi:fused signal recognition particle receptor|nr:signal recognition particle-docking protein FtsY [Bacillota bacterium]
MSLFDKFKSGLERSRKNFGQRLEHLFRGREITDAFFEELEEGLILGDVGAETSENIIESLREELQDKRITDAARVKEILARQLIGLLSHYPVLPERDIFDTPLVILVVGVNGSGKTTTIGKLAHRWIRNRKKVMLVAGDTFRAAAIEQLEIWAERTGAEIVKQQAGSDPSSVYYDALQAARARDVDVVIGDTAGRLHTKVNLMEELKKIHRVCGKVIAGAPQKVMLVIDATTGQNGLAQAEKFNHAVPVSGVILTKLDGTARGGIAIAIKERLGVPISHVGLGEKINDLEYFDPGLFVEALLG